MEVINPTDIPYTQRELQKAMSLRFSSAHKGLDRAVSEPRDDLTSHDRHKIRRRIERNGREVTRISSAVTVILMGAKIEDRGIYWKVKVDSFEVNVGKKDGDLPIIVASRALEKIYEDDN